MTRSEFVDRRVDWRKETRRIAAGGIIVFLGVLFGNIPLGAWMDKHKPGIWAQIAYGAWIIGFPVGFALLMYWCDRRQIRKFGLSCPYCGMPLHGVSGESALATGNCGRCGAELFEKNDEGGETGPQLGGRETGRS
jgi:hypothetical protein